MHVFKFTHLSSVLWHQDSFRWNTSNVGKKLSRAVLMMQNGGKNVAYGKGVVKRRGDGHVNIPWKRLVRCRLPVPAKGASKP
jgi:hypothetical protein